MTRILAIRQSLAKFLEFFNLSKIQQAASQRFPWISSAKPSTIARTSTFAQACIKSSLRIGCDGN
jgi:hypothetical protein